MSTEKVYLAMYQTEDDGEMLLCVARSEQGAYDNAARERFEYWQHMSDETVEPQTQEELDEELNGYIDEDLATVNVVEMELHE